MGSCASSHKNVASNVSAATKLKQPFGLKMENMAVPPPLAMTEKVANGEHLQSLPSRSRSTTTLGDRAFDSKSDMFFDSQTWLESDCEDDFFSVRGDLTPFGNTPLHQNLFKPTPPANSLDLDSKSLDSIPEPPPTNKKKKLSELFRNSIRENRGVVDQIAPSKPITANESTKFRLTYGDFFPKLITEPPYVRRSKSVHIIGRGDGECIKEMNREGNDSNKCCFQVIVSCRSFREKKRMRHVIQGKA